MKIGLLAFHQAINFGATLQLLSTYRYLLSHGHEAIVVNYVPQDLDDQYATIAPAAQRVLQQQLRATLWRETRLCRTSRDVAAVLSAEQIEAVIIGSDAVCQCHTLLERVVFPCRRIIGVRRATTVETFPNALWADWNDYLPSPLPVAVISASSQDSKYAYFVGTQRKEMRRRVMAYAYLSVRDTWTQQMMRSLTRGQRCPAVTPDPVFAFMQNAGALLPSRADIVRRYALPERYILLSFINDRMVSQQWLDTFAAYAKERYGATCVLLPFAHKDSFGTAEKSIPLPLSPLDWYALLLHSDGYVGNNMHPLIVCLANAKPFFSFDNYGMQHLNGLLPTDKSSKIRHILSLAGLSEQRVAAIRKFFVAPPATTVCDRLYTTASQRAHVFAQQMLSDYNAMMRAALTAITR